MNSVVVGLGNVLLGDDGVGPAVCAELRSRAACGLASQGLPAGMRLADGGTLGPAVIPWLRDASAVVIIDAVRAAGSPGEVRVYRSPDWAPAWAGQRAPLESIVAMARLGGLAPEAITLIGVIPDRIGPGLGLSEAVRLAVPFAASAAIAEVRALAGGTG